MTKVRDDAGSAGVRDRAATARGGERGSRFCRTKKRKMLRPLARALRSAELGDRLSLRRADLRMVLLAVRERFVPRKGGSLMPRGRSIRWRGIYGRSCGGKVGPIRSPFDAWIRRGG